MKINLATILFAKELFLPGPGCVYLKNNLGSESPTFTYCMFGHPHGLTYPIWAWIIWTDLVISCLLSTVGSTLSLFLLASGRKHTCFWVFHLSYTGMHSYWFLHPRANNSTFRQPLHFLEIERNAMHFQKLILIPRIECILFYKLKN